MRRTALFLLLVFLSCVSSQSFEEDDYAEGDYEDVGDLDELFERLKQDDYNDLLEKLKTPKEIEVGDDTYKEGSDESLEEFYDKRDEVEENVEDNDAVNENSAEPTYIKKGGVEIDNIGNIDNQMIDKSFEEQDDENNVDDQENEYQNVRKLVSNILNEDKEDNDIDNYAQNMYNIVDEDDENGENDKVSGDSAMPVPNIKDEQDKTIESDESVETIYNGDKTDEQDENNKQVSVESVDGLDNINNSQHENNGDSHDTSDESAEELFNKETINNENVSYNNKVSDESIKDSDISEDQNKNNDEIHKVADTSNEATYNEDIDEDENKNSNDEEDVKDDYNNSQDVNSESLHSEVQEIKNINNEPIGDENLNGNGPVNDYDPQENNDEDFDNDDKSENWDDEFNEMIGILNMLGQLDDNNDKNLDDINESDSLESEEMDENGNMSEQNGINVEAYNDALLVPNPMDIADLNDIGSIEDIVEENQELSQLNSAEVNEKINDFIQQFSDDIIDDFVSSDNVPIKIKLSVDEAVVITSPNYPEPYGGNMIMDWYFDGVGGSGIEFNITDFAVDGNSGDYLLVKPGQADSSGEDGVIFSYMLRAERRYRFLDVDTMYVRFQAKGDNFNNYKGFQFSVKFVAPKPEPVAEPEPTPEAAARAPEETLSVLLSGFRRGDDSFTEQFRQILVDMTTMFVNRESLRVEGVSVQDAVQITKVSPCNINWPDHHNCSVVTFGANLVSDAEYQLTVEQLQDLWVTYSAADPAAIRLRLLGIEEYSRVDEARLLSLWWLLTFCSVLVVVLVGYSLFRYKCFNEYNGMKRLRDENVIIGARKSSLSLYPTPHQTLSPAYDGKYDLYLDGEYAPENDTTRVDMGGAFTNKSFVRDGELMDLDSDEEIVMSLPDDNKAKR